MQGPTPKLNIPASWTATLSNEMEVYGIEQTELPLVNFSLVIDGGQLLDSYEKIGVENLMTDIMMEGTANTTPQELEENIEMHGASLRMFTGRASITVSGNTLVRTFDKITDMV